LLEVTFWGRIPNSLSCWFGRFEHLAMVCNLEFAVGRMNVLTIVVQVQEVVELEERSQVLRGHWYPLCGESSLESLENSKQTRRNFKESEFHEGRENMCLRPVQFRCDGDWVVAARFGHRLAQTLNFSGGSISSINGSSGFHHIASQHAIVYILSLNNDDTRMGTMCSYH
jgi:hypothetical protein